ncbi:MAG: ABC transporter, ATP-binding protein (cluster 5, nickel/peptides/opines), partial [uncultured Microvirga sp.]
GGCAHDPDPSLHGRADRLSAEPQQAWRAAGPDPRYDAFARHAAARLSLFAALPARDRDLPAGDARPDPLRRRPPHGALPPPARRANSPGGV